jgi:hypothetical protein
MLMGTMIFNYGTQIEGDFKSRKNMKFTFPNGTVKVYDISEWLYPNNCNGYYLGPNKNEYDGKFAFGSYTGIVTG